MKNIKLYLFAILCIIFQNSKAQDFKMWALNIPEDIKTKANFVIRNETRTLKILSPTKSVLHVHRVGTVLNKSGIYFGHFSERYNDKRNLKFIKGVVYNQIGGSVEKIRSSKLDDVSDLSSYSLFEDDRRKNYTVKYGSLPYTVEYEYEITLEGSFFIPSWYPVLGYKIGVEKSTYEIIIPKNIGLKYKILNFEDGVEKTDLGDSFKYSMALKNFKPIESEERSPTFIKNVPNVLFTPINFAYDEWDGDLSNWNSFGEWNYKLIQGRNDIPQETVNEVNELVKDEEDKYEIIRKVYEYMQSKTRYISIQIGIGGWQPFKASVVDDVGYGDCKALSNYTKSLLEAVGVDSYYTIIGSGDSRKIEHEDFASFSQMNHAIICVPMKKDTVWLECTSQRFPYGYIGASNSNRYALLITPEGGKLAYTPKTTAADNYQYRKADAKINEDGSVEISSVTKYGSWQFEYVFYDLFESPAEQKKELYERYSLANITITDFEYTKSGYQKPEIQENVEMKVKAYAQKSGKRMFFKINILNRSEYIPRKTEERKTDIVIRNAYLDIDTLNITIPAEYKNEYLPDNLSIETKFGKYNASFKADGDKLIYIRRKEFFSGSYPSSDYADFSKFHKDIAKADRTNMMLIKKE